MTAAENLWEHVATWLRARRLRRLRRAPVQMIDRKVLLRLGAGGWR